MEIIAVISTILCVWLAIKQNILSWPIGIVGSLAYMYIFYHDKMYIQSLLQIVFIIQSIYGWINWKNLSTNKPNHVSPETAMLHILMIFTIVGVLPNLLSYNTKEFVRFDVGTTSLALFATWYLAKKYIETWIWWMVCNIVMMVMFLKMNMYWSMILYGFLFGLNFKGLKEWVKDLKTA